MGHLVLIPPGCSALGLARDLVRVVFTTEDGSEDSVAWAVRGPGQWITELDRAHQAQVEPVGEETVSRQKKRKKQRQ